MRRGKLRKESPFIYGISFTAFRMTIPCGALFYLDDWKNFSSDFLRRDFLSCAFRDGAFLQCSLVRAFFRAPTILLSPFVSRDAARMIFCARDDVMILFFACAEIFVLHFLCAKMIAV